MTDKPAADELPWQAIFYVDTGHSGYFCSDTSDHRDPLPNGSNRNLLGRFIPESEARELFRMRKFVKEAGILISNLIKISDENVMLKQRNEALEEGARIISDMEKHGTVFMVQDTLQKRFLKSIALLRKGLGEK